MDPITPVVLCGGSGTRLWPLSRRTFPKQFVPMVGGRSLLRLTLERLSRFSRVQAIVSGEEHRFLVTDAMAEAGTSGDLILEPAPRNTAAAMALAALHLGEDDRLLLFCPADHHIQDAAAFEQAVRRGAPAARAGSVVTLGVNPSFPATGYGYIEPGEEALPGEGVRRVRRFIEKPDRATAERLLLAGGVLWNAGVFLCRADVLVAALERHAPDILQACRAAMAASTAEDAPSGSGCFIRPEASSFEACRSESIDFAVMEKLDSVGMVPFAGAWSDVGSWNSVAELTPADDCGNRVVGNGLVQAAQGTYVHAPYRTVVALGTRDLLIIDTADAVLVADRSMAEQVKDVVARLDGAARSEVVSHRKVARPWGWYDSVDAGERFQVKRIGVKPGASLSLQMHHHRAEHWVVVRGTAEVTCGDRSFLLTENQSTYIPIGVRHRLRNPGKVELELIEVQSGSYLGEDDIVRYQDSYGRAA
ncbi:mannose-1-phosphate guanylyltransferase/mannose-6-phosphate isomerase [Ramlibacter sp. AW1]|uniref:mannose-1-phosphate guanylyltransferase n=1 Tax=Ramlibacter aurantiacus TaxID=2801330 RepID=A0A936ZYV3_9BURK|nr:mannose-1-phosphate guanylyltransferase/mannose-6-phosphate isomerase [Ramlibacter aurantiacus]MBL0422984.1 mannose-1-phosphate guanylyltransferase/mannose-6-phosphate isomerase [Ramlibacter aurantiacus]